MTFSFRVTNHFLEIFTYYRRRCGKVVSAENLIQSTPSELFATFDNATFKNTWFLLDNTQSGVKAVTVDLAWNINAWSSSISALISSSQYLANLLIYVWSLNTPSLNCLILRYKVVTAENVPWSKEPIAHTRTWKTYVNGIEWLHDQWCYVKGPHCDPIPLWFNISKTVQIVHQY